MIHALPEIELLKPSALSEAVEMFSKNPNARILAGGTDLIVNMRHGLVESGALIDITGISELAEVKNVDGGLQIGAGVTLSDLQANSAIVKDYPAVAQAAASIAGPVHRNAATIGGNLCLDTRCLYYNQSHWWRKSNDYCLKYKGDICHVAPKGNRCRAAFSGDLAPALMVLDAKVEIMGNKGQRQIALSDLYQEDGTDYLTLAPDEFLTRIILPKAIGGSAYDKIRVRGAIDFPAAGVAVACEKKASGETQFKIAVTGTNSMPVAIDQPELYSKNDDAEAYFANMAKLVQKGVSPQRTTTIAPHFRRLSISAVAVRLARGLI